MVLCLANFGWSYGGDTHGCRPTSDCPKVYPDVKARVSGVVFSGIGLGAMLSGTLIPVLIFFSVVSAWIGMGVIALATTILTWNAWQTQANKSKAPYIKSSFSQLSRPKLISVMICSS
ncbi:hypothetical protein VCRA2120E126_100030 [Vibrio crassostreae]|nr:hypothetical protein VCRA2120E126_100030 [Vibrio crassostreae]